MNGNVFKKNVCKSIVLFVAIFVILTVFAKESASQTKSSGPQYGGTLRIISRASPVNLGIAWAPYFPDDDMMVRPAVETLLGVDDQGNLTPWLATGWKIDKDLKSITLTLRRNVKFHDGTDFNAEAVKYLLDQHRTLGGAELKLVTSIDVMDQYTVKLNLSRFENYLLNALSTRPGSVVSPTAIKAHDKAWCMVNPVGTGPFKFVKYERDSLLRFEKFPEYWQKGKPFLNAIEFHLIIDPMSATFAFRKGEADILMRPLPKDVADLRATGSYAMDVAVVSNSGLTGDGDNSKSPFADVRVRRAIDYAIDKEKISKEIFFSIFPPARGPVAGTGEGYNPALKGYPYDPKKAKELLVQAGYPNGFKTRIIYESTVDPYVYVAVQAFLKEVGIEVTLEPVSTNQFGQIRAVGWENGLMRIGFPTGKGYRAAQTYFGYFSRKSQKYPSMYHSDSVENIAMKAIEEPDLKKSKRLAQNMVKIIHDEALFTPIYTIVNVHVRAKNVHDTTFGTNAPNAWTPADAWLSK